MPDIDDNWIPPEKIEELENKYGSGKLKLTVDDIDPVGGPSTGDTRVLVRGGPFEDLIGIYPKPKCRFGRRDLTVSATYVSCRTEPTTYGMKEARRGEKNDTCLQCDNSPEVDFVAIVPFMVSLTGDFSDS